MAGIHSPSGTTRKRLQTTLYDLIAAVSEVAGADDEASIIATVTHLVNSHDTRCVGVFEGYRLVCEIETSWNSNNHKSSRFDSSVSHFDDIGDIERRGRRRVCRPCFASG
jgi:hypothetical protein